MQRKQIRILDHPHSLVHIFHTEDRNGLESSPATTDDEGIVGLQNASVPTVALDTNLQRKSRRTSQAILE